MEQRLCAASPARSTEVKKHCMDDLREQADRVTSVLVSAHAQCTTMVAVSTGMQLSAEAGSSVAAINGTLPPRLDGIQRMLAGQMTSLKSEVVQLGAQVQHQDQRMTEVERQLKDIAVGRSEGTGGASSTVSSEAYFDSTRSPVSSHPPKNQCTVLVVGKFPHGMERDVICEKLLEIVEQEFGVKEWWAPGNVGSVGKVCFHTNDAVWKILRKYNGKIFNYGTRHLWHTWDRPKEEVLL